MNTKTVDVEKIILIDYNVRTEAERILGHVQRQLLATAIINSGASRAVLNGESLPIASNFDTTRYQWLIAFGAMLCERADHAIKLIPYGECVIDGFCIGYKDNYITRHAMPPHEDDYQFQLERVGTEWQVKVQCTVTCLGHTYPDSVEVGHVKGRYLRKDDVTDVEKQMYEATARVWCMQHREACEGEKNREGLDFSYNHDNG